MNDLTLITQRYHGSDAMTTDFLQRFKRNFARFQNHNSKKNPMGFASDGMIHFQKIDDSQSLFIGAYTTEFNQRNLDLNFPINLNQLDIQLIKK